MTLLPDVLLTNIDGTFNVARSSTVQIEFIVQVRTVDAQWLDAPDEADAHSDVFSNTVIRQNVFQSLILS